MDLFEPAQRELLGDALLEHVAGLDAGLETNVPAPPARLRLAVILGALDAGKPRRIVLGHERKPRRQPISATAAPKLADLSRPNQMSLNW